jgi:hypothetical protein
MLATTIDQAAADVELERGLQARWRGDRVAALAHFLAAAQDRPSLLLDREIAREKAALGLES